MKLHFRETPWDLYLAVGYSIMMGAVILAFNVGNVLAILFVLFVPGYVLVAALFPTSLTPRKTEIDWIERIVLSLGLSVAVAPLLGLLLNSTPYGIGFVSIVATIILFTCSVGYAAYWRRMRISPQQRLSLTLVLALPNWKNQSFLDKSLTLALAASAIIAGGTFAYIILTPHSAGTFTEFYILGPDGNASGYPTVLNVSQAGPVIVGIANHESATITYTIRIDLVGVRIIYNTTSGSNMTVEVNRTTLSTFNVILPNGQNWTRPYVVRVSFAGWWKVHFLLFKEGDLVHVSRQLYLFVNVQ